MAASWTVSFLRYISTAIFARICSSIILNDEQLRDMCYTEGENVIKPQENQNISGPCSPWKKSCCTNDDSLDIKNGVRLNLNPCGTQMSYRCQIHFRRKLCFQHCSPYIGPWLINRNESRRHTKIQYVPLCKSECERWWTDCKHDMAMQENWYKGGKLKHEDAVCETIEKKYQDSTYFCEHVFGPFEFLVVSELMPCMRFYDAIHNNQFVAMFYATDDGTRKNQVFNYSGYSDTQMTEESHTAPQTKFLILCFFLGGIIAALGFAIGCVLLAKCRTPARRSTSLACLFENGNDGPHGSELQQL